jgi:hypothetical protein
MLCSLGQDTFIDYLIVFAGLWPWANHFTFFMLYSLRKILLIDYHGVMQIRDMYSVYVSLGPTPLTPERHTKNHVTSNGGCLVLSKVISTPQSFRSILTL